MDRRIFKPGDLILVQKGVIGMVMEPVHNSLGSDQHNVLWFGKSSTVIAWDYNIRTWRKRYLDWLDTKQ